MHRCHRLCFLFANLLFCFLVTSVCDVLKLTILRFKGHILLTLWILVSICVVFIFLDWEEMSTNVSLQIADYVVSAVMLFIPLAIGVFFAIKDAKKSNRDEYLLGGRKMSMLPVALSIFATFAVSVWSLNDSLVVKVTNLLHSRSLAWHWIQNVDSKGDK